MYTDTTHPAYAQNRSNLIEPSVTRSSLIFDIVFRLWLKMEKVCMICIFLSWRNIRLLTVQYIVLVMIIHHRE